MTELADRHRRGIRYVLCTLARLKQIADKVPAEHFAAALRPHFGRSDPYRHLRDYLGDVDEYLTKLRPKRWRPSPVTRRARRP